MTLIEVALVAAVFVVLAAAGIALAQGSRSFGMSSAASQFDAALAYAQSLAADSGNGATLVFGTRTASDGSPLAGFTITVYSGRPTNGTALRLAPIAPFQSQADASEAKLGAPPFTLFLNGTGHVSAMRGAVSPGSVVASNPGCPSGETAVVLTLSDSAGSVTRSLACNAVVSGAPVGVATVAP